MLDPSRKFYVPDQVLEVTMAIKANDVPALGYVQYSIDTQKTVIKEATDKKFLKINIIQLKLKRMVLLQS